MSQNKPDPFKKCQKEESTTREHAHRKLIFQKFAAITRTVMRRQGAQNLSRKTS